MKHIKRHFPVGPSNRNRREGYRIDRTSVDGSGLTQDDGAQMHEPQMSDDDTSSINNADMRNQRGRR
jgi:hypothetical protein